MVLTRGGISRQRTGVTGRASGAGGASGSLANYYGDRFRSRAGQTSKVADYAPATSSLTDGVGVGFPADMIGLDFDRFETGAGADRGPGIEGPSQSRDPMTMGISDAIAQSSPVLRSVRALGKVGGSLMDLNEEEGPKNLGKDLANLGISLGRDFLTGPIGSIVSLAVNTPVKHSVAKREEMAVWGKRSPKVWEDYNEGVINPQDKKKVEYIQEKVKNATLIGELKNAVFGIVEKALGIEREDGPNRPGYNYRSFDNVARGDGSDPNDPNNPDPANAPPGPGQSSPNDPGFGAPNSPGFSDYYGDRNSSGRDGPGGNSGSSGANSPGRSGGNSSSSGPNSGSSGANSPGRGGPNASGEGANSPW